MKKKVFFLTFILSIIIVSAQEVNVDLAYAWLLQQPNSDVFTASLTALAISKVDNSAAEPYTNFIRSQFNANEMCWPVQGCTVKDTVLALITESKIGLNFQNRSSQELMRNVENWLVQRQTLGDLSGVWALQIITPDTGRCSLKYQKRNQPESATFDLSINMGRISYGNCRNQTFFSLNSCLDSNLADMPSTKIEVSCAVNLPSAQISLIYIEGNTIYLVSEPIQTRAVLMINNGFFGNKLDTLYANWALKTINSKINSLIWLKKNAENKVVDNALLYLSTLDNSYVNNLLLLRSGFGNFQDGEGEREFDSGLGALALQTNAQHSAELELVREWLGRRQRADGSWLGDARTTAMVLYGAFEGGNINILSACSNGIIDNNEECDDGNRNNNDGCSSNCRVESGWSCNGEPSRCVRTSCSLSNPKWLNQAGEPITQAIGNEAGRRRGDNVILSVDANPGCGSRSIVFDVFEKEAAVDQEIVRLGPGVFDVNEGLAFINWSPVWFDDNPLPLVTDNPEFYFVGRIINLNISSTQSTLLDVLRPPMIGARQCNDLLDNDADTRIDWPNDPGCINATDNTEIDECTSRWQCTDWSACFDNSQVRSCRDLNDCGTPCEDDEECITERECFVSSDNETEIEEEEEEEKPRREENETVVCYVNGVCEVEFGENNQNCPDDCPLPEGERQIEKLEGELPDLGGTDIEKEAKKRTGSIWIILILFLLLLILAGSYFFIFKKPSGKNKAKLGFLPQPPKRQPLFGPQQPRQIQQPRQMRPAKEGKDVIERELEKSLKEAKRLLGK